MPTCLDVGLVCLMFLYSITGHDGWKSDPGAYTCREYSDTTMVLYLRNEERSVYRRYDPVVVRSPTFAKGDINDQFHIIESIADAGITADCWCLYGMSA